MSPDRAAKAAALREQVAREQPEMFALMETLKNDFGGSVLFVEVGGETHGKEPGPGIQPYIPLPDSTWPYEVGRTAGDAYKTAVQQQKKGRRVKK